MTEGMNADQAERLVKRAMKNELSRKKIICYDLVEHRDGDAGSLVYRITGYKKSLVVRWSLMEMKEESSASQGKD